MGITRSTTALLDLAKKIERFTSNTLAKWDRTSKLAMQFFINNSPRVLNFEPPCEGSKNSQHNIILKVEFTFLTSSLMRC